MNNTTPTQSFGTAWVRVAVNREGDRIWRCFIDPNTTPISILRVEVTGQSTTKNHITANVPSREQKDEVRDLLAWMWYFGEVQITDDVLRIELRDPTQEPVA